MALSSLIIDDEPLAHKVILEYVKEIPYLEIVGQCQLATEAFAHLNTGDVDLIFLDINMPKLKGLDFLRTLSKQPIVIITSAHEEYALESFELDVCDYLLKPFRFERFMKATNKALALHRLKKKTIPEPTTDSSISSQQIFIKSDKKLVQVALKDIHFLESYGNYVKVWLADKYLLTPGSLSSFAKELHSSDFFRIHKSYIINRVYIDYIEANMVIIKNGKSLPIGKMHKQSFKVFIGAK